ncbi:MAG: ABC transporter ATP-binding protein [Lentisphaeria bacterium]|nr:ABC transporter ATP-binding protein [Lentisphaeria bacterium]
MTTDPLLHSRGLTKRYGKKTVLNSMDLDLWEGEVLGLLGPNGAGKTTFIKIILGLVLPNAGEVKVFGLDLFSQRRSIITQVGAVVEAPIFFGYLSAYRNLRHLVELTQPVPDERILNALETVGLLGVAHDKVDTFSYGMKQRLGIAQALLPDTRLLILDEPTNGLDPHGIAGIRRLVRTLSDKRGITILLSSHMLSEVEQMCDRVAIIHHGDKVLETSVEKLRRETGGLDIEITASKDIAARLQELGSPEIVSPQGRDTMVLRWRGEEHDVPALVAKLVAMGAGVRRVERRQSTLEDVFLEHTTAGEGDVRIDSF